MLGLAGKSGLAGDGWSLGLASSLLSLSLMPEVGHLGLPFSHDVLCITASLEQ